jgi:hypothetical protein
MIDDVLRETSKMLFRRSFSREHMGQSIANESSSSSCQVTFDTMLLLLLLLLLLFFIIGVVE